MEDEVFVFLVEWFDQQAELVRKYNLSYRPVDQTIDMYDLKLRRTFLKRTKYDIKLADLFVGNTVNVFGRQLKIVDWGNDFTKKVLGSQQDKAFALLKPDAYEQMGKFLDVLLRYKFQLSQMKLCKLKADQVVKFADSDVTGYDVIEMSAGNWLAIEMVVDETKEMAQLGLTPDMIYVSKSQSQCEQDIAFFFGKDKYTQSPASLQDCSCCVVKPHAFNYVGQIVDAILDEGFEISALETFCLSPEAGVEFLEVYKTVVKEYAGLVEEMISGPCIAMEIKAGSDEKVVQAFRDIAGPRDPEIARHIRPNTLRAKFGVDLVKNGVHCTDLPEDGVLESEFFFSILQ